MFAQSLGDIRSCACIPVYRLMCVCLQYITGGYLSIGEGAVWLKRLSQGSRHNYHPTLQSQVEHSDTCTDLLTCTIFTGNRLRFPHLHELHCPHELLFGKLDWSWATKCVNRWRNAPRWWWWWYRFRNICFSFFLPPDNSPGLPLKESTP